MEKIVQSDWIWDWSSRPEAQPPRYCANYSHLLLTGKLLCVTVARTSVGLLL